VANPETNMEQAILQESERLFLEKGFALTSTTEIAKAVGCNQALIHYYFRTKDHLFVSIFAKKIEAFLTSFIQIDESSASFEDSLRLTIESHFDLIEKHPRLPFLILNELTTNPARVGAMRERLQDIVGDVYVKFDARLNAEIEKGTVRPMSSFDLMFSFISMNVATFLAMPIMRSALKLEERDLQRIVATRRKEIVEMILRGIRP